MRHRLNILTVMLMVLVAGVLPAQEQGDWKDTLLGDWKGSGILFGQEAHFSMTWAADLNGTFLTLTFQNGFTDKSGVERVMNAQAYYQLSTGKGYWFDSRGVMQPLSFEFEVSALVVNWGEVANEQGKTVYTLVDPNTIHVQDYVYRNDAEYQFGEAQYKKAD